MEENLPFWEMEPADELSHGGGTIPVGVGKGQTRAAWPAGVRQARRGVRGLSARRRTASGTLDLGELKGARRAALVQPAQRRVRGRDRTICPAASGSELGTAAGGSRADWVVAECRTAEKAASAGRPATADRSTVGLSRRCASLAEDSRRQPRHPGHVPTSRPTPPRRSTRSPATSCCFSAPTAAGRRITTCWPSSPTNRQRRCCATHEARPTRRSTTTTFIRQVDYLARAYVAVGERAWREACLRGFDFMLAAQLASGGFPQRYPDPPAAIRPTSRSTTA